MRRLQYPVGLSIALVVLVLGGAMIVRVPFPAALTGYAQGSGTSLRFYGNGVNDIDRVKVPIDGPARPVDVGGDFTLEFWMKASLAENGGATCSSGADQWIYSNIMFDRDVYGDGDNGDYGVALANGRISFGVSKGNSGETICGGTNVANGVWHHIAVTRSGQSGALRIFVDGQPDGQGTGPTGDVSYRDGRSTVHDDDPFLVIGAEKHDAGSNYPSYSGWIDEVRISKSVRYSGAFTRPSQPFTTDSNTVGLYHFDEGSGDAIGDGSGAMGGPSNGTRRFGGSPAGPLWSSDTPFGSAPPATPTPTSGQAPPATPTSTPTPTPTSGQAPPATPTSTPTKTPRKGTPPPATSTPTPSPTLDPTDVAATVTALPERIYLPKVFK